MRAARPDVGPTDGAARGSATGEARAPAAEARTGAVRVQLPAHLRTLARVGHDVVVDVPADAPDGPVTIEALLDALEARYPVLRGTIRDHDTGQRRAFVRFFVLEQDRSHDPTTTPLPPQVISGEAPFIVLGAMAGG